MADVYGMDSAARLKHAHELVSALRSGMVDTSSRIPWSTQNFAILDKFTTDTFGSIAYYSRRYRSTQADEKELSHREFIWDFTAFVPHKGLVLAAESEWVTGRQEASDLLHDFDKLLCSRAPLKLMLCRHDTRGETAETGKALVSEMERYMNSIYRAFEAGEVIVIYLRGWTLESGRSNDSAYIFQVPGEVHAAPYLQDVSFAPVDL